MIIDSYRCGNIDIQVTDRQVDRWIDEQVDRLRCRQVAKDEDKHIKM